MKHFKLFGAFVLSVFITVAALSFFMPTSQRVEKSVIINAPATVIFEQIVKLENFNKWSFWNRQDSSVKHILTGTDGTAGAATTWTGDPEISGDGKIEIIAIESNKKVIHTINFINPKKNKAESVLSLSEINPGVTTVTWKFTVATPRPKNIFNLFYSMEKEMGKGFTEGLLLLKTLIEKK